jgi:sugar lactone lactonase YvrE
MIHFGDVDYSADGMTIDEDGLLYVATFGGNKVLKINPSTKKIEAEVKMPVEQITSVAFGGPNLDILYVTTCGANIRSPQTAPAGGLFKITGLGVKGTKMYDAVV